MAFTDEIRVEIAAWLERARRKDIVVHVPRPADRYIPRKGMHFHPLPEVFFQVSGISIMNFGDGVIHSRPGEILVVPRGAVHLEMIRRVKGEFRNLVVMFGQKSISIHEALAGASNRPGISRFHRFSVADPGRVYLYLDELIRIACSGSAHSADAVQGLIITFVAALLDVHENSGAERIESYKTGQCRRFVNEHISSPDLNVRRLAELIRCSPDYLSNLFHKETGIKLADYINAKRIDFAKSLLENSPLNISEVAGACGYSGAGYFTRQFRRRAGRTPREYRRSMHVIDGRSVLK